MTFEYLFISRTALEGLRLEWERRHPPPHTAEELEMLAREIFVRFERWLDEGHGSCELKDPEAAKVLTDSMHHFDGVRYELDAYVVMPNHAHAIVRPTNPVLYPLESIIGSWKQFSARRIHAQTGDDGRLWQGEAFDRIIRDDEHLYRSLQYVGCNPEKANLPRNSCPMWIRPDWEQLGWTFEHRVNATRGM
jgi:REP element-mobilizing transposase RayT